MAATPSANPETAPLDAKPDVAALEKLVAEADTGGRDPKGAVGKLLLVVAVAWSAFQVWYASPLPFTSKNRAIIAAPQTLYVKATPYFSTSSGTFAAPILTAAINTTPPVGTTEPSWVISSTQGVAAPPAGTTAYAVVDSEIVSYGHVNDPVLYDAARFK